MYTEKTYQQDYRYRRKLKELLEKIEKELNEGKKNAGTQRTGTKYSP